MSVKTLFRKLDKAISSSRTQVAAIKDEIQSALNAQYEDWQALKTILKNIDNGNGVRYCTDEAGEACLWTHFHEIGAIPENEREFFENYLSELGTVVDWENNTLSQNLGTDEIFINDHGRKHDRGVYQSGSQIISEAEYTDENGDVDELKRNEMIEAHMESTGYFPGVFRTSEHDNEIYPVKTQK